MSFSTRLAYLVAILFGYVMCGQGLADALNEEWMLTVGGQVVRPNANGSYRISNITTPDRFGTQGSGSQPDFVSDDFLRLTGFRVNSNGTKRYVWSQPFQIGNGQSFIIRDADLTFSDTPFPKPEFLRLTSPTTTLSSIGQTVQLTTIAIFPDATADLSDNPTQDVTPRSKFTVYRSSNPTIANVSIDGLLTARGDGEAIISAVNSMVSTSLKFTVALFPRTTVEGLVRFQDGLPAAGAIVTLIPQGQQATTGADGKFTIANVRSDEGNVSARITHAASGLVALLSNAEPVANGITDLGIGVLGVRTVGFEPFGVQQNLSDDSRINISLGTFTFPYFGQAVTGSIEVGSNGILALNATSNGTVYQNYALPSSNKSLICPFFDDIDPGVGGLVGVYQSANLIAVTWELVPYFGRNNANVTFQTIIRSNGVIEFRYSDMSTPPGGTADDGVAVGTATVGIAKGTMAFVPSTGTIVNALSTFGITDTQGFLNADGLLRLTEAPNVDTIIFTPNGGGGYVMTFN